MEILSNTEYQDELVKNETYTEMEFKGCSFEHCRFANCDFSSSHFKSCSFESCTFESCNLSTLHIDGSTFRDVNFIDSKLIGILWYESRQRGFSLSIKFNNSLLNYSSFYGLDLQKCSFNAVSAVEVDFTESNLTKCILRNTDLSGAIFSQTILKETDFTTASNYQLDLSNNRVRGAKFSMPEAINLLHAFGIKIQL